MTLKDYLESNRKIADAAGLNQDLFCDLSGLNHQSEFLQFFKFYSETLKDNRDYGIEPSYLFFVNCDTMNARAGRSKDGNYIIGVNRGTINWLIHKFKLNHTLVTDSHIFLFDILEPHTDSSINNLMFQAGCHFTFYHEMAHLVQKSQYLESNIEENPKQVENFDINRHLLEIDADSFSALCFGTHIIQYSEKIFGSTISKPLLEALIVLFSVPIILYLLSFSGNALDLYYKERTHPHPAIRITNFLIVLTHYCNGVLDKKNLGFTANQGDVFLNAMGIAEDLQEQFFDGQTVSIYREMVTKNRPEVIQYLGELIMLNEVMDSTATAKWNKYHIR